MKHISNADSIFKWSQSLFNLEGFLFILPIFYTKQYIGFYLVKSMTFIQRLGQLDTDSYWGCFNLVPDF